MSAQNEERRVKARAGLVLRPEAGLIRGVRRYAPAVTAGETLPDVAVCRELASAPTEF